MGWGFDVASVMRAYHHGMSYWIRITCGNLLVIGNQGTSYYRYARESTQNWLYVSFGVMTHLVSPWGPGKCFCWAACWNALPNVLALRPNPGLAKVITYHYKKYNETFSVQVGSSFVIIWSNESPLLEFEGIEFTISCAPETSWSCGWSEPAV